MKCAREVRPGLLASEIVEQSLGEAEYLWERRERSLSDPTLDLDGLWDQIEDRLGGALAGLTMACGETVDPLLVEAIQGDEPARVAAAAYALGSSGEPAAIDRLGASWAAADEKKVAALARAGALADDLELLPALRPLMKVGAPPLIAGLLDAGRLRRLDPTPEVTGWMAHDSPRVQAAAVAASRYAAPAVARDCVGRALHAASHAVRQAGIQTGVLLGMRAAWSACREEAAARTPDCGPALLLLALVGGIEDHRAIVAASAVRGLQREALWALGFAGSLAAAEACVDLMCQDVLPALAAEALCAIVGLDLRAEGMIAAPPPLADDEDAGPAADGPAGDRGLPDPDVGAIVRWWHAQRGRFRPEVRYLSGQPISAGAQQAALASGPLRRRHPISLELAIRSQGRCDIVTSAFVPEQRRQLLSLAPVYTDVARSLDRGWVPAD